MEKNISPQPGAFTIVGFADALHIGRSTVYELIESGQVKTFHVGRRRLISFTAAQDFIEKREAEEAANQ